MRPTTGDLVMLRSGGPLMTVLTGPRSDGLYEAAWFVNGDLKRDSFCPDEIALVRLESTLGHDDIQELLKDVRRS